MDNYGSWPWLYVVKSKVHNLPDLGTARIGATWWLGDGADDMGMEPHQWGYDQWETSHKTHEKDEELDMGRFSDIVDDSVMKTHLFSHTFWLKSPLCSHQCVIFHGENHQAVDDSGWNGLFSTLPWIKTYGETCWSRAPWPDHELLKYLSQRALWKKHLRLVNMYPQAYTCVVCMCVYIYMLCIL